MVAMEKQHVFSIVPIEVALDKRLTLRQTKVLIALFSFQSEGTNTVRINRSAISDHCGLPLNRISAVTSELVRLGWLVKAGDGGGSRPNLYQFVVPNLTGLGDENSPVSEGW
jgi:hypothetical protein